MSAMWHAIIAGVGNCPHNPHVCAVCTVHGYNTTPISNDGVARLGSIVQLQVQVLAGADLGSTNLFQWGRPDSEEVI